MLQPIRSTTQIWVVTRHQYGISALFSRGTADVFPVVASLPPRIFFGGREATTGNTSAVRRLRAVVMSRNVGCFSHASGLALLDDTALNFNTAITFRAAQHMEEKMDTLIRLGFQLKYRFFKKPSFTIKRRYTSPRNRLAHFNSLCMTSGGLGWGCYNSCSLT